MTIDCEEVFWCLWSFVAATSNLGQFLARPSLVTVSVFVGPGARQCSLVFVNASCIN